MTAPAQHRAVLIDLRVAQYNGDRGIPAYSQSLVRQLCQDHPGNRYFFLWDERLPRPACGDEFEAFGSWVLEQDLDRGQQGRIDVLFTACYFLPLHGRGAEYLYPRWLAGHQPHRLGIVYDLIPYLFPDRYLTTEEARFGYMESLRALRESDRLFAISQATRLDTIRLAGFDPRRIHCVYGDIDHRKRTLMEADGAGDPAVLDRHGLRGPYCVYIGGEDWRKNMDGMVRSFAVFHARRPDHQLAILCKLAPERIAHYQRLAREAGIRPGAVVLTGYVSDEDLVAITRRAEMMVYPSLYEGLGLPVLEAYGCGVPVVGSNTSSIQELLIPALGCDPARPEEVAAAMERLIDRPELREESLAYGRRLLASLGWRPAAAAVIRSLEPCPSAPPSGRSAVVGALPPAATAIAPYTLAGLQSSAWRTDFFDANPEPELAAGLSLLPGNRLLPAEVLPAALARGSHDTVIFVLGNSPHHVKTLRSVMATRLGCRQRRLAYLHEANLAVPLRGLLGDGFYDLPAPPPATAAADWIERTLAAVPDIGRSLLFLAETAHCDGLLVNSAACRALIEAALGPVASRWTIDVIGLPIMADEAACPGPATAASDPLHVGTFGTGGDSKRLDVVAKSLQLVARDRPVRLTVAGWAAARQCRLTGVDRLPFVEIHDAPTDDRLDALMRAVDVAVQLRVPTHGESSGAVARLLGLGKQVVVTGEGSFTELPPELTVPVPAACTATDLAAAIAVAAGRRLDATAWRQLLDPFSPPANARRLATVLGVDRPAAVSLPVRQSA